MRKKLATGIIIIIVLQFVIPILSVILQTRLTLVSKAESENQYNINSEEDFWEFAKEVNKGNNFKETTVFLNVDLSLGCNSEKQWIPIGTCSVNSGNEASTTTDKCAFSGVFEGNNHTISGIYIDSENNYVGLFGYNEGTIQNLTLKESYIKSNKAYIGGIAAFNKRNN